MRVLAKNEIHLFVVNVPLYNASHKNPCLITVFVFVLDYFTDNYVSKPVSSVLHFTISAFSLYFKQMLKIALSIVVWRTEISVSCRQI